MAKFCGKCGTKLDESTGLCPNCNKEQLSTSNTAVDDEKTLQHSSDKEKNTEEVQVSAVEDNGNGYDSKPTESTESREAPLSKKEIKKQRKKGKKEAKKAKKREKRANWSTGKKIRRFLLKLVIIVMILAIVSCGIVGALVHFDIIDIPIFHDVMEVVGIEENVVDRKKRSKKSEEKRKTRKLVDRKENQKISFETCNNCNDFGNCFLWYCWCACSL